MRLRDLGLTIGRGQPGPLNAITDVPGVRVGHTTLISGDGPLVVGQGPVRTGVTVVSPRGPEAWREPVFAGLPPAQRQRRADRPRVGPGVGHADVARRDHQHPQRRDRAGRAGGRLRRRARQRADAWWSLPVVGETYDGLLNDINGFHVKAEHLRVGPRRRRRGGPVAEGARRWRHRDGLPRVQGRDRDRVARPRRASTAASPSRPWSRRTTASAPGCAWTASRSATRSGRDEVPSPYDQARRDRMRPTPPAGSGSIIVVLATDAPLLPHQCERLAQRAGLGIARAGGTGGHTSGDLFIAFATGNRIPAETRRTLDDGHLRRQGGRRQGHRPAVRRRHRIDRGGDRQRPGRRADDRRAATGSRPTRCRTTACSRS